MFQIKDLCLVSLLLIFVYGCSGDDADASSTSTPDGSAGAREPTAGADEPDEPDEPTAGADEPDEPTAGADEPDEPTAGEAGGAEPDEPELPLGREDDFSSEACSLLLGESAELIATDAQAEAGQVTLLPSAETAYRVKLSDTGVGYITLEVPDWAITVGIFTHSTQSAKIITSLQDTEIVGPLSANASCVEFTDERVHFHSWGAYVLELTGEPNGEVQLALIKRQ